MAGMRMEGFLTPSGADILYDMGKRGSEFYCKFGPSQSLPYKCVVLSRRRAKGQVTVKFRLEDGQVMTMAGP